MRVVQLRLISGNSAVVVWRNGNALVSQQS